MAEGRCALAANHGRLGDTAKGEGRLAEAKAYYGKSLAIRKTLAKETKTVNRCDDLAIPSYRLGCIESLPNKRTDLLREALKIWEALMKACPDDPAYKERYDAVKEMLDS